MFSKSSHTIVLVTFDSVARVDVRATRSEDGAAERVVGAVRAARPTDGDVGTAVAAALAMGPPQSGCVYVLCEDIWAGRITLAPDVARWVAPEQFAQTLALEAESESGISPFGSRVGFRPLGAAGNESAWWVSQADEETLQRISAAVANTSGRLVAVGTIDPGPEGMESATASDSLTELGTEATDSTEACAEVARRWLARYRRDPGSVAAIAIADAEVGRRAQQRIAGVALAVVLVLCGLLHWQGGSQLDHARATLAAIEEEEQGLRRQHDDAVARVREREIQHQQRREAKQRLATMRAQAHQRAHQHRAARHRPVALLRALAATAAPEHWIQHIRLSGESAHLSGVAVDSMAAAFLAGRLEEQLGRDQWRIDGTAIDAHGPRGLVSFTITAVSLNHTSAPVNVALTGELDAH